MTTSRVAMYLRHSTADKGDSIAGQRALCRDWLKRNDIEHAEEFAEDAQSAYSKRMMQRPQWAALEEEIRAGRVTHVIARHIDRLTRNMRDLEDLVDLVESTGVRIDTCWSGDLDLNSPASRQTARILASVAVGESETKSQRIKASKARARAAGRSTGGPRPFGYESLSGGLRETEAAAIREGCQQILDGVSLTSVCAQWTESGVPTSRGGTWHRKTCRDVLMRWRNAGRLEHQGDDAGPATYPAIVSLETLQAVRGLLSDPSRRKAGQGVGGGPRVRTLLSGLAVCDKCGHTLKARSQPDGHGGRTAVYCCSGPGCYLSMNRADLDRLVTNAMVRFFMSTDVAEFAPSTIDRDEITRLRGLQASLSTERAAQVDLLRDGILSATEAREVLAGIESRKAALEADIERLSRRFAMASTLAAPVVAVADDGVTRVSIEQAAALRKHFLGLHLDVQRRLVEQVWKVAVRPRPAVKALTVNVAGDEWTEEGMTYAEQQERRAVFTCRVKPSLSFDPEEEARQELMSTIADTEYVQIDE